MSDPTVQFTPGMPPRPVQPGEPMTTLVFDQELVGRLQALLQGGFSNRAEQVIAEHLVKVGRHRAGGRTPREIKEYIWQQMQWGDAGVPAAPHGDLHSLRQSVRANTEVMHPPESYRPQAPAQPPTQPGTSPTAPSPAGGPADRGPEGGSGARVLGGILALVPRALLALSVYQLVRLIPGFEQMPDAAAWGPFHGIGDAVLGVLNLDPDWSDQAANLTIPVLGVVLVTLLNVITPLRRDRRLRAWPYTLVIGAWVAVFAASGLAAFASDTTENLNQSIQDQVDETLDEQVDQLTDDASDAAKEKVEDGQGAGG
ncbi:hypothetical protein GCM10028784_19530 [Myceligenerans cantabricum]